MREKDIKDGEGNRKVTAKKDFVYIYVKIKSDKFLTSVLTLAVRRGS